MKRSEILGRLPFTVPPMAKIRMIVDTDAKNEADDQFAIMHHLLTPSFDVRAVIATHFEAKDGFHGKSMERSYREAVKVLQLAEIDDVPVLKGCVYPVDYAGMPEVSAGVDFIIEEAMRPDDRKLFIAVQGAMTNVAAALLKAPEIADKITVLWNGGGPYPTGRPEFNVAQDSAAVRALLESRAEVWQIPQNVYGQLDVSLAELCAKVRSCGEIGKYLIEQLLAQNRQDYNPHFRLRTGEDWVLGDNVTVGVLLEHEFRGHFTERRAPILKEDLTYEENQDGKMIRVYHDLDMRFLLEDFFAKMQLAYQ